jgi:phosphoribosylformylglycinamidine cyclo-ligase|tara:strand:+ start:123 stop:1070 length:948 start_codon:yes stop_codon:yes gene_type:complete
MNYKDSGVDIEAGKAFVDKIRESAPSIGGFNGMYKIPEGYEKPLLVSGADGVGTKINICQVANDYTTIGIDLVAMCVNDVICCGADPLYFLDYISTPKLDENCEKIVQGIIEGCEIAGVELLGGETAEHPRAKDYDLAGFCTGIVEQGNIIDGRDIKEGDKIIGIGSSGLHSNGFSLINDMLWRHKIYYKDYPKELLQPTEIYAKLVKTLVDNVPILGMAHITGGGIPENLPRCLPEGLKANIDWTSWERPEIFNKIKEAGEISEEEMRKTFNMGIGFCLVVPEETVEDTQYVIRAVDSLVTKTDHWVIGEVVLR